MKTSTEISNNISDSSNHILKRKVAIHFNVQHNYRNSNNKTRKKDASEKKKCSIHKAQKELYQTEQERKKEVNPIENFW